MKIITAIFFTFFSIICFSQETVIIRTLESFNTHPGLKKQMVVVDENNETTTYDLKVYKKGTEVDNLVTFKSKLDEYIKKGYEIISSDSVSAGWNSYFVIERTYILKKKTQ